MAPKPRLQLHRRQGTRKVVALGEIATQLAHALVGILGLDSLGNHRQAESACKLGRRLNDHGVALIVLHAKDEGLVDLQLVHRELLEIGERGVPHPEVIEGDAHAHLAQPVQHLSSPSRIGHQDRLRDLHPKSLGRDAVPGEQSSDIVRKVRVKEACRG